LRKRADCGDAAPNMKNVLSISGAIFLAMVVVAGCGGSGGTCGNTAACGGDIVGAWTITSTCVGGAATTTCDQLNQTLMGANKEVITCTGSSICACNVAFSNQTSMATGTYTTTAAGLLTTTPMGGLPDQLDYCAKGKTLTLSPHANGGMMGQAVAGTITLTKS
jgi:hypothetical protein